MPVDISVGHVCQVHFHQFAQHLAVGSARCRAKRPELQVVCFRHPHRHLHLRHGRAFFLTRPREQQTLVSNQVLQTIFADFAPWRSRFCRGSRFRLLLHYMLLSGMVVASMQRESDVMKLFDWYRASRSMSGRFLLSRSKTTPTDCSDQDTFV